MHRRKRFVVYPPNYQPLTRMRYRVFRSKRQALKQARRWGTGATMMDAIYIHPKPRTSWQSSFSTGIWELA